MKDNIKSIFPNAVSLKEYFKGQESKLVKEEDSELYKHFCKNTFVVPKNNTELLLNNNVAVDSASMKDVLNGFVVHTIRKNHSLILKPEVANDNQMTKKRKDMSTNILTYGYRAKRRNSDNGMRNNSDVECFFVNTTHLFWADDNWKIVVSRIGESLMRVLLSELTFMQVENRSFVQISGEPIHELLPVTPANGVKDRPSPLLSSSILTICRSALSESISKYSQLIIPRGVIFYGGCTNSGFNGYVAHRHWMVKSERIRNIIPSSEVNCEEEKGIIFGNTKFWHKLLGNDKIRAIELQKHIFGRGKAIWKEIKESRGILEENTQGSSRPAPFKLGMPSPVRGVLKMLLKNPSCRDILEETQENDDFNLLPFLQSQKSSDNISPGTALESIIVRIIYSLDTETLKACALLKESYKQCKIQLLLDIYCPDNYASISSIASEKRKRGCRAGKHVQRRSSLESIVNRKKDISFSEAEHCTAKRFRKFSSVGKKLLKKLNREPKKVSCECSYKSQESIAGFSSGEYSSQRSMNSHIYFMDEQRESSQSHVDLSGSRLNIIQRHHLTELTPSSGSAIDCESLNRTQAISTSWVGEKRSCAEEETFSCKLRKINDDDSNSTNRVNLHSYSCSKEQVSSFLKAICRCCFTIRDIWGSRHNSDVLLSFIDEYVGLGRYESMRLSSIADRIRVSDIPWLLIPSLVDLCEPSDRDKLFSIINEIKKIYVVSFLSWMLNDFINPLLYTNFYVTEAEGVGSNFVLFYRKHIWAEIVRLGKQQVETNFVKLCIPVTNKEYASTSNPITNRTSSKNSYGSIGSTSSCQALNTESCKLLPHVRFVPKPFSVRAITNMRYYKAQSSILKEKKMNSKEQTKPPSFVTRGLIVSGPLLQHNSIAAVSSNWGMSAGVLTNGALYNCLHLLRFLYDKSGYNFFNDYDKSHIESTICIKTLMSDVSKYNKNCDDTDQSTVMDENISPASWVKGFSCAGLSDVYEKFRCYKLGVKPLEIRSDTPYFIASVDLEKCYDNVDTAILYNIVRELVKSYSDSKEAGMCFNFNDADSDSIEKRDDSFRHRVLESKSNMTDKDLQFMILRYNITHYMQSMERTITKRLRFVVEDSDIPPFPSVSEKLSEKYSNSLISDGVIYPSVSTSELLKVMSLHLFNHVVKLPILNEGADEIEVFDENGKLSNQYADGYGIYNQVKGIPQGSILSPLLCTLYYNFIENLLFGSAEECAALGIQTTNSARKSCIVRLVDDYLIISTDKQCVEHFLSKVHSLYSLYGAGVNPAKTKVNFPCTVLVNGETIELANIAEKSNLFPWCGYNIEMKTLDVLPDFSRIVNQPLQASVSVEYSNQLGSSLRRCMKSYIKSKCHALLLDLSINAKDTVISNVYNIFKVGAVRAAFYIRKLLRHSRLQSGSLSSVVGWERFVVKCIKEAVLFGARLLRTRDNRKDGRKTLQSEDYHSLSVKEALNLGYMAYIEVLTSSPNTYWTHRIVKQLRRQIILWNNN